MQGPYTNAQQINDLITANNQQADATLLQLAADYETFFRANQIRPHDDVASWAGMGNYFLDLALRDKDVQMPADQFKAETANFLELPIPEWVDTIVFKQTFI